MRVLSKMSAGLLRGVSAQGSRAPSSGGLRVGRGHHVSSRLLDSLRLFVPQTTVPSLRPPFGPGVRASATLGRPRVANGPTCLSASRHLCSDPPGVRLFPRSSSRSLFLLSALCRTRRGIFAGSLCFVDSRVKRLSPSFTSAEFL